MVETLKETNGEFEWTQEPWGRALRCRALPVPHLFTSRDLVLRGTDGQPADGWHQLEQTLGVEAGQLLRPRQVHADSVTVVTSVPRDPAAVCGADADIIMTRQPGIAIAVQAADCVPLLLADQRTGAVAAAHAGWRGTAAWVAATAVKELSKHFGSHAGDLVVAIGPSIGPCCYQVGDELLGAFGPAERRWFYRIGDRLMLNLWRANRDQLLESGVAPANIHVSELCTAMDAGLFHSFRRDGKAAGRLAAAIRTSRDTTP